MSAMTTDPVLPAAGVTLTINCRTGDGRARRHTAELGPDWAFSTPHDLDLERIGVALGGSLTCVRLADHDLPAARDFLEHRHRVRPAAIVQHDALEWGTATPASDCACDDRRWTNVVDAATHVRTLRHWAAVHRTRLRDASRALEMLRDAGVAVEAGNPVGRAVTENLLAEPDATDILWGAGVPFALVPDLCRSLSPLGDPIPVRVIIAQVYAPEEWAVLEPFVAHGPLVLAWASQHRTPRDVRRPTERLAWVEAGVPLPTIDRVFAGMAYDLVHARAYAATTGTSLATAAAVLGRWQESGTTPPVADLVGLHALDPHAATAPRCAPARAAVERVVGLAARRGLKVTPSDAALALARAGTAPDAVALLTRTTTPTSPMEAPR